MLAGQFMAADLANPVREASELRRLSEPGELGRRAGEHSWTRSSQRTRQAAGSANSSPCWAGTASPSRPRSTPALIERVPTTRDKSATCAPFPKSAHKGRGVRQACGETRPVWPPEGVGVGPVNRRPTPARERDKSCFPRARLSQQMTQPRAKKPESGSWIPHQVHIPLAIRRSLRSRVGSTSSTRGCS